MSGCNQVDTTAYMQYKNTMDKTGYEYIMKNLDKSIYENIDISITYGYNQNTSVAYKPSSINLQRGKDTKDIKITVFTTKIAIKRIVIDKMASIK